MTRELDILGQKPRENSRNRRRYEERSEDLEVEWGRQSVILAGSFARKLGFPTNEAYIKTLPKFGPKPENLEGILDVPAIPVIVEARIPLAEMLNTVRIDTFFDPQKIEDWREGGFETPKEPYATWLTYVPNKSVIDIRVDLPKQDNQRGGTIFDGIALCQRNPRILDDYFLKFPGSQVGVDDCPFIFAFSDNNPLLSYGNVESASPKFACVIASKI